MKNKRGLIDLSLTIVSYISYIGFGWLGVLALPEMIKDSKGFYQQIQILEEKEEIIRATLISSFKISGSEIDKIINSRSVYEGDKSALQFILSDVLSNLQMSKRNRQESLKHESIVGIHSTFRSLKTAHDYMNKAIAELHSLADTILITGFNIEEIEKLDGAIQFRDIKASAEVTAYTMSNNTGVARRNSQEIEQVIRLYTVAAQIGSSQAIKKLEHVTDAIYNTGVAQQDFKKIERAIQLYTEAKRAGSSHAAKKLAEINMDKTVTSPVWDSPAAVHSCQTALAGV